MRLRQGFFGLLVISIVCVGVTRLRAELVDSHYATLLLRTLAYDRNLKSRPGKQATIAVIFEYGDPDSSAMRTRIVAALHAAGETLTVSDLRVKVVEFPYISKAPLGTRLIRYGARALYVCSGLGDKIAEIAEVTQQLSVLSYAGTEAYVAAGLSVGIIKRDGKPTVKLNLAAARAEGADLDPALVKVSEVVN